MDRGQWHRLRRVGYLLIAMFSVASMKSAAAQDIHWVKSVEQALQQAVAEDKLVLLHFGADYCAPCRNLESFVFTEAKVAQAIHAKFVPVKIDIQAHPELAERYSITRIPQDVFLTPDGQVVFRRLSPNTGANYRSMLEAGWNIAIQTTPRAQQTAEALAGISQEQVLEQRRSPFFGTEAARAGSLARPNPAQQSLPFSNGQLPTASTRASAAVAPETFAAEKTSPESFPGHALRDSSFPQAEYRPQNELPPVATPFGETRPSGGLPGSAPGPAAALSADPAALAGPSASQQGFGNARTHQPSGGQPSEMQPTSELGRPRSRQPAETVNAFYQRSETEPQPRSVTRIDPVDNSHSGAVPASANDLPPDAPTGLEGFCPVSLLEQQQWVKGNPEFGCFHRGVLYLFADQAAKEAFLAAPDDRSPMLGGYDPVLAFDSGKLQVGQRRYGVFCESPGGKPAIVLFATAENRDRFKENSLDYLKQIRRATEMADQQ